MCVLDPSCMCSWPSPPPATLFLCSRCLRVRTETRCSSHLPNLPSASRICPPSMLRKTGCKLSAEHQHVMLGELRHVNCDTYGRQLPSCPSRTCVSISERRCTEQSACSSIDRLSAAIDAERYSSVDQPRLPEPRCASRFLPSPRQAGSVSALRRRCLTDAQ